VDTGVVRYDVVSRVEEIDAFSIVLASVVDYLTVGDILQVDSVSPIQTDTAVTCKIAVAYSEADSCISDAYEVAPINDNVQPINYERILRRTITRPSL